MRSLNALQGKQGQPHVMGGGTISVGKRVSLGFGFGESGNSIICNHPNISISIPKCSSFSFSAPVQTVNTTYIAIILQITNPHNQFYPSFILW